MTSNPVPVRGGTDPLHPGTRSNNASDSPPDRHSTSKCSTLRNTRQFSQYGKGSLSTQYRCVRRVWPIRRRQRAVSAVRGIETEGHDCSSSRRRRSCDVCGHPSPPPPSLLPNLNQNES